MLNQAPLFSAVDSTIERVSTNSAGEQANYGSYEIAFFPDGTHIAFTSEGRNLVAGDNNNRFDVFVKNLQTGVVTRVSTDAAGAEGNDASIKPVFLPGGDKIAFVSSATNLVPGDTNGLPDIFIKDLATGAITRASIFTDGTQFTVNEYFSTTGISAPDVSPDGTKMAFAFHDGGGATIYIKDLITGTLTVAVSTSFAESVNLPGARFSPDGSQLLYRQYDTTTGIFNILLKDLASGTVTLVSTNSAGQPANFHSEDARFSGDGTRIVFSSYASNLVAGDTNGNSDIFVKDLVTGAVTPVSINAAGVLAGGYRPVISPDGSKVAFSAGSLMVPGDTNAFLDIVVKDLLTGEIVLASISNDGHQSPTGAENAVFSPDGTKVGFYSDGLVAPDPNGYHDLYLATLTGAARYVEGGPAVQIVPVARVFDHVSTHYAGGSLSVAISAGSVSGDQLSLALSNAPGQGIALSGDQILVNGSVVGTLASTATSLVISFNANATDETVELLTEAVRISSTSDDPTAATRTVTFTLVDGGGTAGGGQDTASFSRKVVFVPVDDEPGRQLIGGSGPDFLEGSGGNDFLDGGFGDDTLFGFAGNDSLDGGAGNDEMAGGAGNDSYFVDSADDTVFENAGEGTNDIVYASADFILTAGSHVEILLAEFQSSTASINLTGNELDNIIYGSVGANILRGGGGADIMFGFAGDDSYFVDHVGDLVIEAAGEGHDVVYAQADFILTGGSHVEVLVAEFQSSTAPINLTGNELDNVIYGSIGANILRGGGGADIMFGFAGNDSYYADHVGDLVIEAAGEGNNDVVYASADFILTAGSHVEILVAEFQSSTAPINLTGNELDNVIYGSIGANILRGGAGADILFGFAGNDSYYADHVGDLVIEAAGEGHDVVYASADFILTGGSHVEVLLAEFQSSGAAINLTGNEQDNAIYGSVGANILRGGGGSDVMVGFAADDSYYVDSAGDTVFEAAGEGHDVVYASADYVLAAGSHVEVLLAEFQSSGAAISLTGNDLANSIFGSVGDNVLNGGAGADVLTSFAGADTFAFTTALGGGNVDFLTDMAVGVDRIALDDAMFAGLAPGALAAGAFRTGSSAQDADDRIVYDAATGALYFDADGNGAGAAVQFAMLQTGLSLTAGDFTVI